MGTITVYYVNGLVEKYYYNSYTKDIWDEDMKPVNYEYVERMIGNSHAKARAKQN
jgi:hypothetical protein